MWKKDNKQKFGKKISLRTLWCKNILQTKRKGDED